MENKNSKRLGAIGVLIMGFLLTTPWQPALDDTLKKEKERKVGETVLLTQIEDSPKIDLDIIRQLESAGKPFAYNRGSGARGLYQITEIALDDYLKKHPKEDIGKYELYSPGTAKTIANWYLNERIPELLEARDMEVNTRNILGAYNYGIGNLSKGGKLPEETSNYIENYLKQEKRKRGTK